MKVAVLGNGKAGKLIAASISDCIPNPAIITRNNCGKIEFNLNIGNESRICNIDEKNNYNTTDQFDCVFVATKSYQALEALLEIKANISTKTILILIQNLIKKIILILVLLEQATLLVVEIGLSID